MRSKLAAVLVGGAFLLSGAPMALAKTTQHQFMGELSKLDATAKTLAVKEGVTNGREMDFTLAPGARIVQGVHSKSLEELKVGEKVKVTYDDEGSKHQARRIEVLPPKTARIESSKTSGTTPKAKY